MTYRLTFDAEGFEAEGGRSVEDLTGTLVSPLPYVVGWHADGDLGWISAGGPGRTVEFIGVDPRAEPGRARQAHAAPRPSSNTFPC